MTSFQSELGESGGIAEELAESQRAISIAEFFEKNKHMLGFDSGARGLVTAVKEAVDNALDACEESDIYPDIYVEIRDTGDYYTLVVEDNGPGITRGQIPKVFGKLLYGSRFHKREMARGQQGIGISAAVLYSQLTSGKPARVTSRTNGSQTANYYELVVDTDENEPEIKREAELSPGESDLAGQHGTRIEMEMEANMRARSQLHDYIEGTAVVNPHARIELVEPGLDEPLKYERVEEASLPAETSEIRPHPHGVELGTVRKMLEATASHSVSGFLQEEFTRVGRKTADTVIDAFRDRRYGRELAYRPPLKTEVADLEPAVRAAVSNKRREATAAFARDVAERVDDRERVVHHQLRETVAAAADEVEGDFDTRFGDTVREKATAAAWHTLVGGEGRRSDSRAKSNDDDAEDRRVAEFYRLVDAATTDRKADATVERLAERLATRVAGQDDDRDRVTRTDLREYVDWAADGVEDGADVAVGDTARENVVETVWTVARAVPDDPPKVRHLADDRDAVSDLVDAMRATDIIAPPTDCLAPIGADDIEAGLRKGYDADFYAAASRDAEVSGGDPFVVEAGIAYGGEIEDGSADVLRFANRVPLVYQRGACAVTDVLKSIGWRNYKLDQPGGSGVPNGPAVVMVHVASTNVPFTSESKDAVANVPEIESEIELAVREAARELKSFLKQRQSMQKRQRKQDVLTEILPEMADKVAEVTGRDRPAVEDAMARIMGNVLVDRSVDAGDEVDRVEIAVENHSETAESLEVTDIVDAEPRELNGATAVAMDDEHFVRWDVEVGAGETARLSYELPTGADGELTVDSVEPAKLTVGGDRGDR
ncbi:DNA topoisomerase VI subunit B [Halobacteriales archaeon SW_5_70_135]|nr:MAG: DNA topoisomerase VI subunit B [Halobacteriales archaeon SW_5_70_135]